MKYRHFDSLSDLIYHALRLPDPRVLILDEPFEEPRSALRPPPAARPGPPGATIFITSPHQLRAVQQVGSEVAVRVQGELVFHAPTDQLRFRVKDELTQERYADQEEVFVSLVEDQQVEAMRRMRPSGQVLAF